VLKINILFKAFSEGGSFGPLEGQGITRRDWGDAGGDQAAAKERTRL
jgi:hypothetical protein